MLALIGLLLALLPSISLSPSAPPDYTIQAVRYATIPQFPLASLVVGAPADQRLDIAMVIWVIRGDGRTILFDSGFHRARWIEQFKVTDFLRPDSAVAQAAVSPESVTDIVVSHAHWDHMGGIDLFPKATVWIQKQEYMYYLGDAWQQGGRHGGIDADDLAALLRKNTSGKLKLIDGDDQEILPGIRVYTGARHTYASTRRSMFAWKAHSRMCWRPITRTCSAISSGARPVRPLRRPTARPTWPRLTV